VGTPNPRVKRVTPLASPFPGTAAGSSVISTLPDGEFPNPTLPNVSLPLHEPISALPVVLDRSLRSERNCVARPSRRSPKQDTAPHKSQSYSWICCSKDRELSSFVPAPERGLFLISTDRLSESRPESRSFVSSEQLIQHILAYAEVLFRWKLLHKRIELLKAVDPFLRSLPDWSLDFDHSQLGTSFAFVLSLFLVS
jgi:hypothetical protein